MSRYIDIDRLEPQQFENSEVELGVLAYDYEAVQSEPYIDIVRCRECVYCVDAGAQKALVCDNSHIDMDIHPEDFCSYGERSE